MRSTQSSYVYEKRRNTACLILSRYPSQVRSQPLLSFPSKEAQLLYEVTDDKQSWPDRGQISELPTSRVTLASALYILRKLAPVKIFSQNMCVWYSHMDMRRTKYRATSLSPALFTTSHTTPLPHIATCKTATDATPYTNPLSTHHLPHSLPSSTPSLQQAMYQPPTPSCSSCASSTMRSSSSSPSV